MTFTPTAEQLAAIGAARDTKDNLLISALAGAAKTSTLVLIAEALAPTPILSLAFNKRIALEMKERLPPNCECKTLNSLGHSVWGQTLGQRLNLNAKKTYDILTAHIESLTQEERSVVYENFSTLMRAVDFGKTCGWVPDGHFPSAKRLMTNEEFFDHLDEEPTKLEQELLISVTLDSIRQAYKGTIDFNDQILMPTIFLGSFPQFPIVLVDEAQDLSALNHVMLRKLLKTPSKQRIIAVGDERQAIYGFRGAHADSMKVLEETFSMVSYGLSISFRCPQSVVEEARWRAPHMQWPKWAKEGSVTSLDEWDAAAIADHAAIICRNNAPLFSVAMKLLKNGRYVELVGNDIGRSLLKIMKKMGKSHTSQEELLSQIDAWEKKRLVKAKGRSEGNVRDQAECLRIFAREAPDLGGALAYAEHLLSARGPIQLMTGHKSKGLEFNHVYFLDQDLINPKAPQDLNLKYVVQTRAKETLTYITSEGFIDATSLSSSGTATG